MTEVFPGIDWAEGHHDVARVHLQGNVLTVQRIEDTAAGLAELLDLLCTDGDHATTVSRGPSKPRAVSSSRPSDRAAGTRHQTHGRGPAPQPARGLTQQIRCLGRRGAWLTFCAPIAAPTACFPGTQSWSRPLPC